MATLDKNIITDMGILSNEAYDDYGQYFVFDENGKRLNSTIKTPNGTYTIIDSADTSTSMQALLLKSDNTSQFVIAFRGTKEVGDVITDLLIGVSSLFTATITAFNAQRPDAEAFVAKMMKDYNILPSNLTLTGHSLGGILTQSVGATKQIPGYAFNTWSSSNLIDYVNILDPLGVVHHIYEQMFNGNADQIAYAMSHIQNFSYVDSGMLNGDILSNGASNLLGLNHHLGSVTQLYGQDLGLGAHSMIQVNNVISVYNEILSRFTSDTTYKTLTDAYLVNQSMGYFFSDNAVISKDMYDTTNQYFLSEANIFEAGESTLRFNFLNDLSTYPAQQMVHLTANDEFRANFPLNTFNNPYSKPRIAA